MACSVLRSSATVSLEGGAGGLSTKTRVPPRNTRCSAAVSSTSTTATRAPLACIAWVLCASRVTTVTGSFCASRACASADPTWPVAPRTMCIGGPARSAALLGVALARGGALLRGCRAFGRRTVGSRGATQVTALARRGVVFRLAPAGAALLAAAGLRVHRGPCAALGFALGHATVLIALLDVLRFALLL